MSAVLRPSPDPLARQPFPLPTGYDVTITTIVAPPDITTIVAPPDITISPATAANLVVPDTTHASVAAVHSLYK